MDIACELAKTADLNFYDDYPVREILQHIYDTYLPKSIVGDNIVFHKTDSSYSYKGRIIVDNVSNAVLWSFGYDLFVHAENNNKPNLSLINELHGALLNDHGLLKAVNAVSCLWAAVFDDLQDPLDEVKTANVLWNSSDIVQLYYFHNCVTPKGTKSSEYVIALQKTFA